MMKTDDSQFDWWPEFLAGKARPRLVKLVILILVLWFSPHGLNSAYSQFYSAGSIGPNISTASYLGNLGVGVKAQPSSEADGRMVSLMFLRRKEEKPRLGFSIVFDPTDDEQFAQITHATVCYGHDVACWKANARIAGKKTSIVYTLGLQGQAKFLDVLVIGEQAFDLRRGRILTISYFGKRKMDAVIQQSQVEGDLEFLKAIETEIKQIFD